MKKAIIFIGLTILIFTFAGCKPTNKGNTSDFSQNSNQSILAESSSVQCISYQSSSAQSKTSEVNDKAVRKIYGASGLSEIKKLLSAYPEKILQDDILTNSDYMVVHGKVVKGQAKWDEFYTNTINGKDSAIVIIQYTVEGDPLLIYLSFLDGEFYYVMDFGRDKFKGEGQDYNSGVYKYLKIFDRNDGLSAILFNDNSITYEKYIKSTQSGDAADFIPNAFLFEIIVS